VEEGHGGIPIGRNYLLVCLGSGCISLKISAPSFDEKKPAHLGHLTIVSFVSFDVSRVVHEHPKQNKDMTATMQKIVSQFRIGRIPSFLFYFFFVIMREIRRSVNRSEKLSGASFQNVLEVFNPFVNLIPSNFSSPSESVSLNHFFKTSTVL
jgi:hypothetical protein